VKVYGSQHPMSKRTEDTGMAKRDKTRECTTLRRHGEGVEVRHLDPYAIRD